jgi:hypothetical protein
MDDTDLPIPTPPPESGVNDPNHILRGKISMNCVLILPGDAENSSLVITALRLQPCGTYEQDFLHEILLENVPFWNRLAESSQNRPMLERRNAAALPSEKDKKEKEKKEKKEQKEASVRTSCFSYVSSFLSSFLPSSSLPYSFLPSRYLIVLPRL